MTRTRQDEFMQVRYGHDWWPKTQRFEGPEITRDQAVALMDSRETVHIEVTDHDQTIIIYAITGHAGTVSWWRSGVLQQEHALRRSAHDSGELYTHSLSVPHDDGERVVQWETFPSYGVASRQEHHYPSGEHEDRTWHALTRTELDLLSVPGPIDPLDVGPLVEPARLEIAERLESLPAAQFGPLPTAWPPDTVTAPAVRTYGPRRVSESNALRGFITAREAERRLLSGEPWCMDLQPTWPGTASDPRITVDVTGDKIFVHLRHGQHSVRGIAFDRTAQEARVSWIEETRWGDSVQLRPPLWVPRRDPSDSTSLFIPPDGPAEIDQTGREDWTPLSPLPPRLRTVASVEDVAALALEAQHLTIDGLLED
ncbi:hypothetical protein BJF86_10245 [Serinicoccus sp. CNJ-927]|nr:hypothetical protein BJF86_10245 [Serinicoccus sp. CNJ-927]